MTNRIGWAPLTSLTPIGGGALAMLSAQLRIYLHSGLVSDLSTSPQPKYKGDQEQNCTKLEPQVGHSGLCQAPHAFGCESIDEMKQQCCEDAPSCSNVYPGVGKGESNHLDHECGNTQNPQRTRVQPARDRKKTQMPRCPKRSNDQGRPSTSTRVNERW